MNVILSRPNWRSLKRFNSELRRPTLRVLDTGIKICLLAIIIHDQNWAKWVESSTLSKYSHLYCSADKFHHHNDVEITDMSTWVADLDFSHFIGCQKVDRETNQKRKKKAKNANPRAFQIKTIQIIITLIIIIATIIMNDNDAYIDVCLRQEIIKHLFGHTGQFYLISITSNNKKQKHCGRKREIYL